jgi:hypothetical protein
MIAFTQPPDPPPAAPLALAAPLPPAPVLAAPGLPSEGAVTAAVDPPPIQEDPPDPSATVKLGELFPPPPPVTAYPTGPEPSEAVPPAPPADKVVVPPVPPTPPLAAIRDVPKVVFPPVVPVVPLVTAVPPPPPPPPMARILIHFTEAGVVYVPEPERNFCTVGEVAVTRLVTLIVGIAPGVVMVMPVPASTWSTQFVSTDNRFVGPALLDPTHPFIPANPPSCIPVLDVTLPVKVGVSLGVRVTAPVVGEDVRRLFAEVTEVTPPPAPQADPVVVRSPAVDACTQFPEVNPVTWTFCTMVLFAAAKEGTGRPSTATNERTPNRFTLEPYADHVEHCSTLATVEDNCGCRALGDNVHGDWVRARVERSCSTERSYGVCCPEGHGCFPRGRC